MLVDLRELVFADTSLMIDLALLSNRLRHQGNALRVRGAQPQIVTLMEATGLSRLPGVRVEGPASAAA